MSKFTPGPWALAWEDGKHGVVGAATEGKLVCIVGNNPDDDKNDIRKANATLIAAAPDLLAACIDARDLLTNVRWTGDDYSYGDEIAALDAVIAKAKGTHAHATNN